MADLSSARDPATLPPVVRFSDRGGQSHLPSAVGNVSPDVVQATAMPGVVR